MTHAHSPSLPDDDLQYGYPKSQILIFMGFLLLYEMSAYVANDMIMPGMLQVVHSFNASDRFVPMSLTAFILGGSSLQIMLGPLSDCYGRRPVMLSGVGLFLICTLLIAFSQSIHTFILMRFFQGMGLCFISVIGYAVLQESFNEVAAVRLVAIMNNISILAPLAGPLLGSLIMLAFSWRAIFFTIATTTAISLIGLWYVMPETVGTVKKDGSVIGFTSLRFPVVKQNYVSLFLNKRFMLGSATYGLSNIPIIAWIGMSPLILMKMAHLSVMVYALWQIPIFLSASIGNIVMRRLSYRMGLNEIIDLGSRLLVLSLIATGVIYYLSVSYYVLIFGISVYAFAMGLASSPLNRISLFSTPVPKGTASAALSMILMVLTACGNQIAGWFYTEWSDSAFGVFCLMAAIAYFFAYRALKKVLFDG